jgi:hypothetical protein
LYFVPRTKRCWNWSWANGRANQKAACHNWPRRYTSGWPLPDPTWLLSPGGCLFGRGMFLVMKDCQSSILAWNPYNSLYFHIDLTPVITSFCGNMWTPHVGFCSKSCTKGQSRDPGKRGHRGAAGTAGSISSESGHIHHTC